ncbi:MAG: hypothetical protein H6652_22750 [Ardenticatenaceae bacterium]|nr:hypothetical protein [Ardenticatenaceae bacterium]MCB8950152.1 hypothetical protein [Ardenticatenaceae bacterium]
MLVIPIASNLYKVVKEMVHSKRLIFVTGIPGVGKSLLIQQMALIASEAGREVHLLHYNLARRPFETEVNITKYPEIDGVTDPAIRKAVGLWARQAVCDWHEAHPAPNQLLIGELPLIGNRLIELVEPANDDAESLLTSEQTLFVVPVPSWEVREVIETTRARTVAEPQNEQEKLDAPPNVLQFMWQEVNQLARNIGLTKASPQTPYNPYIYGGVFEALLQHRPTKLLLIDEVLRPSRSVYDLEVLAGTLVPSAAAANQTMAQVESQYSYAELAELVQNWHALITDNPKPPDAGPELRLPLPETLAGAPEETILTAVQRTALQKIINLPLDAAPEQTILALDEAIEVLGVETAVTTANVHKFDVYDSYFNVSRSSEQSGLTFLHGLLQAYRNVLLDLQKPPHTLTIVELPLLRIALETSLRQFDINP